MTHKAAVRKIEIAERKDIKTPWPARRNPNEMQAVYHLDKVEKLPAGIINKGQRFSRPRWTSQLAMQRASILEELFLETEPEWRLYEDLQTLGIAFHLEPGQVRVNDPDNPRGRTWFMGRDWCIRYAGASGFVMRRPGGSEQYFLEYNHMLNIVKKNKG